MKYLSLVFVFALTGCYQTVNFNDIETAIKACGSLEKVNVITSNVWGSETVVCTNRTHYWLDSDVWKNK